MSEKHIFALHTTHLPSLQNLEAGISVLVPDFDLWHRIITVLHLSQGEECILFDDEKNIHLTLLASPKKGVIAGVAKAMEKITPIKPAIHLFQGILKREAFNDAMYLAAQMGACQVTPLVTQKVQRSWGGEKESERLYKVMIAACEQAKQFSIPVINKPVELSALSLPANDSKTLSLFCEPSGMPLLKCLQNIATQGYQTINIFIGPEGGFVQEEQELLKAGNIAPHALTTSILRSQEAVAVILGSIRSVAR